MRISDSQRFALPQLRIGKLRAKQIHIGEALASGERINRPSDDPLGARMLVDLTSEHRRVKQFERNIDAGRHLLQLADGVLDEANNTLLRAKEIGIRGVNGIMSQNDRDYMADDILSFRDHLKNLANTRTQNRYIFGGFISDTPPYDNAFGFVGDTNKTQYEVGDGELVDATISGGSAFGDGTAGTTDVFDNLQQLADAIRAGNVPDLETELARLEGSLEQVVTVRQRVGLNINRLSAAETITEYMKERLPDALSHIKDTDFTQAVSDLKVVENTLQATLATSSRLMNGSSLLDYL